MSTRLERKMSRCFSNVKRETAAINQRGIPVCFRTGFRRKGGAFQVHDSWEVSRYEKSIRHPLHIPPTSPPFFPPLLLPRLRNHSPTFYPFYPIFFLFFFLPLPFLVPVLSRASSESILDFQVLGEFLEINRVV